VTIAIEVTLSKVKPKEWLDYILKIKTYKNEIFEFGIFGIGYVYNNIM
jgi:hypothetical protein